MDYTQTLWPYLVITSGRGSFVQMQPALSLICSGFDPEAMVRHRHCLSLVFSLPSFAKTVSAVLQRLNWCCVPRFHHHRTPGFGDNDRVNALIFHRISSLSFSLSYPNHRAAVSWATVFFTRPMVRSCGSVRSTHCWTSTASRS